MKQDQTQEGGCQFNPQIRLLDYTDAAALTSFFLGLDSSTRRSRFAGLISDLQLRLYVKTILSGDAMVYGAFHSGGLCGVAELHILKPQQVAEFALLVDPQWQCKGLGEALFDRLSLTAHVRGITEVHLFYKRENSPMHKLALRHQAHLSPYDGEIDATVVPRPSDQVLQGFALP